MGSTLIDKNRLPRFFIRDPSHKLYLLFLLFRFSLGESFDIQFLAIFCIDFDKEFNQNWFIVIKVFVRILGERFEIQFLAIFYIDFKQGFNQIWHRVFIIIRVFHWNIRGTLIQNTP